MNITKYKRLIWLLPMIGLLIAVPFIGSTLAYNTDSEKQTNQLQLSNVRAEIDENFPEITSSDMDGNTLSFTKEVRVDNTGTAPCFVRVYLDFSDSAVRECSELSQDGSTYYPYADYLTAVSDGWIRKSDGYFYYTRKLAVGEETTELLSRVRTEFPVDTDPYAYDIIIYSEAVQAVGSDGTVYEDYNEAFSKFDQ